MTILTGHLAGDGITADVTITVQASPPEPPRPPMQVGLTAQRQDFLSHFEAFQGAQFCRVFAAPERGLPSWPDTLPPSVDPWFSWKDPVSVAEVAAWVDSFPVGRHAYLTWQHECDAKVDKGGVPVTEYRSYWRALWDGLAGHPRRSLLTLVPIQTLQATGNKHGGDWRPWWVGVGDGVGIDCYADSWADRYPDPEAFLALPFELSEGVNRPLWLPELGAIRMPSDPTGAGRAAWITDVVAILRERGCAGVAWWCAPGTNARDFHLADSPSADAWRAAIGG